MILLADESVDKQIVDSLRNKGVLIDYVAEMDPGISDKKVLQIANNKKSPILTADKDFGELVHRQKLNSSGVILIRLSGLSPSKKAKIVVDVVANNPDINNAFMVISPGYVRIRHSL